MITLEEMLSNSLIRMYPSCCETVIEVKSRETTLISFTGSHRANPLTLKLFCFTPCLFVDVFFVGVGLQYNDRFLSLKAAYRINS